MGLHKKILRTMREHKSQYLGATVLIALSCLLFSLFNITGNDVASNLAEFKSSQMQEDASVILKSELSDIPSLESEYAVLIERRGAADAAYGSDATLRLLSATQKIDKYAVVKGRDISGNHEILIDPAFAKAHRIAIGSAVKVFGREFTVSGYVSTPDYIYPLKNTDDMMKNPDAFGIAVVSEKAFEDFHQGYWFYSVKFNGSDQNAFKNWLEKNNTVVQWVGKEDNMRISFINGDIKGIKPFGTVLPLAILIVTCVLVAVVLWRLLKRELTQIGVFYAIGYRKREILRHYLVYPAVMALAGGAVGTLSGALLVKSLVSYVSTFYNLPVPAVNYLPLYLALSIVLPFVFLISSALFVIMKALRMSPLQLVRGGVRKSKINFFERSLKLQRFRFNTKYKIREIVRNISRTILLFAGVVCASALLLLGFSTKDSLGSLLGGSFSRTYRYSYIYSFNSLQTQKPGQGETGSLLPATFTTASGSKKVSGAVYGIQTDARLINLTDSNGNRLDYRDVIVTKALAYRLQLQPGDSVTFQNKLNQKSYTLRVDEIADFYMGDFIYLPIGRFNSLFGYPQSSYLELYSDQKLGIPSSELVSTTDRQYILSSYKTIMQPIEAMAGMIGAASFLIGLIILYVVTSLLIEENRENISLLKILGYDKKSLYALMLNPYTVFVILGYILSVPLIYYSVGLFFNQVTAEMNMSIPVRLDPVDIAVGFVILFLTYELSKLLNRKKIAGVSMSDGMKNKWE